jgi:EcoEI R protein C-terminal
MYSVHRDLEIRVQSYFLIRMTAKGRSVKIIAFIRQAAIGDALIPHETRVNAAIQRVLARNNWTDVQRKWLNCTLCLRPANPNAACGSPPHGVSARKTCAGVHPQELA